MGIAIELNRERVYKLLVINRIFFYMNICDVFIIDKVSAQIPARFDYKCMRLCVTSSFTSPSLMMTLYDVTMAVSFHSYPRPREAGRIWTFRRVSPIHFCISRQKSNSFEWGVNKTSHFFIIIFFFLVCLHQLQSLNPSWNFFCLSAFFPR